MRIFCPAMVACRSSSRPPVPVPRGDGPPSRTARGPRPVAPAPATVSGPRGRACRTRRQAPPLTRRPEAQPEQCRTTVSADRHRGWGPPGSGPHPDGVLLVDLRDLTGADGAATLADRELEALLHGDRLGQLGGN